MIKFTSPAGSSFSMMDADAHRMIELMGHTPGARGALSSQDVSDALQKLRSATQAATARPQTVKNDNDEDAEPPVSLSQRAFPLIEMLEQAQRQDKPVLWGM